MKKKVLVVSLCVALVAILACGSLAYFTAYNTKTNTFKTATYDGTNQPKPDDIFSVVVKENGTKDSNDPASVAGTSTANGLEYKDLVPGANCAKKVSVTNTGDYSQYVRVKITVTNAAQWLAYFGEGSNLVEKLTDINEADWQYVETITNSDGSLTYVYNYADSSNVGKVLAANATTSNVFTKVMIPGEGFDKEDFATVDGFQVKVMAEAIQSQYTGTITEAFAAFDKQNAG